MTSDVHILELKQELMEIVKQIDEIISVHDFRVVEGPTHTNLIFDTLVPYKFRLSDEELVSAIREAVKEKMGSQYFVVTKVDKDYTAKK